ncbi:hypothetical protein AQUCO_04900031v1, partial [Aquilegia coerulea]
LSSGAIFEIRNQCSYTVWAAASPGGGQQLNSGQSWTINVNPGTTGRIWGRTNCNFDGNGRGRCQTGDCNGLLECQAYGSPPITLAEYAINQFNNMAFYDVSLVDGFNIPMDLSPTADGCKGRGSRCSADINRECPNELRVPGGCDNPCTVINSDCCRSGLNCRPTNYSRFFKERCPDAVNIPNDDPETASRFTCPSGTNYITVLCFVHKTLISRLSNMYQR